VMVVAASGAGTRRCYGRVIIVVDHLEKLFTPVRRRGREAGFITWLWRAASGDNPGSALALRPCAR